MKDVFDKHYIEDFRKAGLLERCGNELPHLISDAATMQIIRWTDGGFGMAACVPPRCYRHHCRYLACGLRAKSPLTASMASACL